MPTGQIAEQVKHSSLPSEGAKRASKHRKGDTKDSDAKAHLLAVLID